MGKKIKSPVKAVTNAVKNFSGLGPSIYATEKVVKALGPKAGSAGPVLDRSAFDIQQKAAEYEKLAQESRIRNLEANQRFTDALEKQSRGEGPSLATAQLKAAQNRNLAQTLSAAQAAGSSPLATRQLLQQRGQSSRDLAELGGIQRMQEQQQAQQMLGQQIGQQANIARGDIAQGFDIAKAPQEMLAGYEQARFGADVARRNAVKAQQSQMLGSLIGAGGSIGAAMLSDEEQKQPPKSNKKKKLVEDLAKNFTEPVNDSSEGLTRAVEAFSKAIAEKSKTDLSSDEENKKQLPDAQKEVSSFLDKLSAKKYEYKDPTLPGAAEGERVGIIAQDLEKSSLGKSLVKNTENGKMVDTVQGFGAILAAQAELNRRLKKLEKK